MRLSSGLFVAVTLLATVKSEGFQECFDRDSISCLQTQGRLTSKHIRTFPDIAIKPKARRDTPSANLELINTSNMFKVLRVGKRIFEKPSWKLFGGLSLDEVEPRKSRWLESDAEMSVDKQLEGADSFSARQDIIEDYFEQQVAGLWRNRTLRWNALEAGKSLLKAAQGAVRKEARNFAGEGRGKLKMMKMMTPLLMAMKLKFLAIMKLSALVVVVLAKKAIVAAVLSIVISTYLGLKALLQKRTHHHHIDYHAYESPSHHGHYSGSYAPSNHINRIGMEASPVFEEGV